MKEFGKQLAKSAFPKIKKKKDKPAPTMSKAQAKLHRKFLRQNKTVNLSPEPKPVKQQLGIAVVEPIAEAPNWSKIRYDHETYTAQEVTILIRPAPDVPPRLLLTMRNVRGYLDLYGSLLLRPATAPAEQGGTLALPAPTEAAKGRRSAPRTAPVVAPIVLGGRTGLNPAKEGTKRFFLVESIFKGGTAVEILKHADKMGRTKGGYKKGEIRKAITPTTKSVTEFAEQVAAKIGRAGKNVKVVVEGKHIKIVPEDTGVITLASE